MGTHHDEQERDIERNGVSFESQQLPAEINDDEAKKAPMSIVIKRAIVHYHNVLTVNQLYLFIFTIGVCLDTLLLYIPVIHETKKCVTIDNKLKIITLVVRSVTDIFFLENILLQVLEAFRRPRRSSVCYFKILVDILAIAPLPQVLMVQFFTGLGSSNQLIKMKGLNSIIMLQYFPRIIMIYLAYLDLKKGSFISPIAVTLWNLTFFFCLSHIFGSFWYFFSVQREMSCWFDACKQAIGCVSTSFDCKYNSTKNMTFISNFCSTIQSKTSTTTTFDFGIYEEAIQIGLLFKSNFPEKFLYSFLWGLRNLSSCGQNLQSSGYLWETCFAAFVTAYGLMLFLYFIGQVQVYIELLAAAITKEKWKRMKYRELDVKMWLNNNNIQNKDKIKETIMQKIQYMPEIKDVDLKILLPLLRAEQRRSIKSWLCHPTLKKVAAFQSVDGKVLNEITTYLKPVIYAENNYIIREGEPLGFMLLITEGIIWNFKTRDGNNNVANIMGNCRRILKGNVYGEQLLERTLKSILFEIDPDSDILISDSNVKAHTKVEAFAIKDKDIRTIVSRFKIPIIKSFAKSGNEVLNPESSAALIIQGTVRWRQAAIRAGADRRAA